MTEEQAKTVQELCDKLNDYIDTIASNTGEKIVSKLGISAQFIIYSLNKKNKKDFEVPVSDVKKAVKSVEILLLKDMILK